MPYKSIRENFSHQCAIILSCYRKHCSNQSPPGQLILPESLKLLPMYANCLLKSDALLSRESHNFVSCLILCALSPPQLSLSLSINIPFHPPSHHILFMAFFPTGLQFVKHFFHFCSFSPHSLSLSPFFYFPFPPSPPSLTAPIVTLDEKCWLMYATLSMNLRQSVSFIYPKMMALVSGCVLWN